MKRMPLVIARNACLPKGLVGWFVALGMELDTKAANRRAVEILGTKRGEVVLDVGCGNGVALESLSKLARLSIGVDPSPVMVSVSRRRLGSQIRRGIVDVYQTSAADLAHIASGTVDRAMTLHTIYFWRDPIHEFLEIHRVLRSGGMLLLGMRNADDSTFTRKVPPQVYHVRSTSNVIPILNEAGFPHTEAISERVGGRLMVWIKAYA